jgi:hypothetical protein
MVDASSHVPLYSVVESTQRVYGLRLIFVSARTNKRHHHNQVAESKEGTLPAGSGVAGPTSQRQAPEVDKP